MTALFAFILALAGFPQATPLNRLVDAVDRTFASMKDFSAEFVQISKNSVNHIQQDEGHLYLTKDHKMRWEYKPPAGKSDGRLYVSNGKTLFTYTPDNHEVTREQVKDSTADQIPMMFLVGHSNLKKEFKPSEDPKAKPAFEGNRMIHLIPNRKNLDIESVDIEVNPRTNLIARMIIWDADKSSNELIFTDIQVNSNIPASKFEFSPPPGARVVQGVN